MTKAIHSRHTLTSIPTRWKECVSRGCARRVPSCDLYCLPCWDLLPLDVRQYYVWLRKHRFINRVNRRCWELGKRAMKAGDFKALPELVNNCTMQRDRFADKGV